MTPHVAWSKGRPRIPLPSEFAVGFVHYEVGSVRDDQPRALCWPRGPATLHSAQLGSAHWPAPGWWHRMAWQRHTGEQAELVALCGLAVRMVASEQSDARDVPGSVCQECAIVMDQGSSPSRINARISA